MYIHYNKYDLSYLYIHQLRKSMTLGTSTIKYTECVLMTTMCPNSRECDPHTHQSAIAVRVACMPSDLVDFCEDVAKWMDQDQRNVIAVHCKGGKGRTGTMISAWLVRSGLFPQAQKSLAYFRERRTDRSRGTKNQGVDTPSQVCQCSSLPWPMGCTVCALCVCTESLCLLL